MGKVGKGCGLVGGVAGLGLALELADIPLESPNLTIDSNEIVGQEIIEAIEFYIKFCVERVNFFRDSTELRFCVVRVSPE